MGWGGYAEGVISATHVNPAGTQPYLFVGVSFLDGEREMKQFISPNSCGIIIYRAVGPNSLVYNAYRGIVGLNK